MANEEDPKQVAKQERQRPEVERMLRQFLNTDGPKGNKDAYREGWERIFGEKKEAEPFLCVNCGVEHPSEDESLACDCSDTGLVEEKDDQPGVGEEWEADKDDHTSLAPCHRNLEGEPCGERGSVVTDYDGTPWCLHCGDDQ
jgi:hypothetical protein